MSSEGRTPVQSISASYRHASLYSESRLVDTHNLRRALDSGDVEDVVEHEQVPVQDEERGRARRLARPEKVDLRSESDRVVVDHEGWTA